MPMPQEELNKMLNTKITLLLKDRRIIIGRLSGFDDYMNMVLEDTEEEKEGQRRRLGMIVLRGNNVVRISPFKE